MGGVREAIVMNLYKPSYLQNKLAFKNNYYILYLWHQLKSYLFPINV